MKREKTISFSRAFPWESVNVNLTFGVLPWELTVSTLADAPHGVPHYTHMLYQFLKHVAGMVEQYLVSRRWAREPLVILNTVKSHSILF